MQFILQDCRSPSTVFPATRGCLLCTQPCKICLPLKSASLACHEWQDKVTKSILLGPLCLFQAYSARDFCKCYCSLGKIKQLLFLWLLVLGCFSEFVSSPPNERCLSERGNVQTMKEIMCCKDSKSGVKQGVILQPCLDKRNWDSDSCGKLA